MTTSHTLSPESNGKTANFTNNMKMQTNYLCVARSLFMIQWTKLHDVYNTETNATGRAKKSKVFLLLGGIC